MNDNGTVEYIHFQGKQYPVRVSYLVMKRFQQETGKSLTSVSEEDIEAYETILFYALQSGAKATGTAHELRKEEMEDVLDECFMEFVNLLPKFFPDTSDEGNLAGNLTKPNEKKSS